MKWLERLESREPISPNVQYRKTSDSQYELAVRLEWPTEITETVFFEKLRALPKVKTHSFLS